ncbi:hypothetical protein AK830_g60 [Neonectria ditissima]|uniref:Ecp2 effector protein domain-containing protein n=1 Tax=Neonectria ditissima TaxID=78410 RepID=A0A0N8H969_9HYPO|nr:hypothetical protein AK830_g60 [Neonectria ditissima]
MRLPTSALLLLLPAFAQAFTLPSGLTDGVYTVDVNEDGTEIHKRLPDDNMIRDVVEGTASLEKRTPTTKQFWCGCAFPLDHTNCDLATADLKNQVTPAKTLKNNYYSIRGNVVAFVCNPYTTWGGYYTDAEYLGLIFSDISSRCGQYIAGTSQNIVNLSYAYVGYMQYSAGLDFCATSTSSKQSSC